MLESLRSEFIREAQNAPKLFRDLAKVEQYIAESYKTRALIELIQNADDAESTIFGIHDFQDGFVVGNNGRAFTIKDVEALCRSGSSYKQRGGNTIGYRGIGFKSVINLSRKIYVFSGDFAFYFDKHKTQEILQANLDVPLVRIPHPFEEDNQLFKNKVLDIKNKNRYQTVFVFKDLNERMSAEEFENFDRSSLLFLNNLRNVRLNFKNIKRGIHIETIHESKQHIVKITEDGTSVKRASETVPELHFFRRSQEPEEEWEVLYSKQNPINRVAFKRSHDTVSFLLHLRTQSFIPLHPPMSFRVRI